MHQPTGSMSTSIAALSSVLRRLRFIFEDWTSWFGAFVVHKTLTSRRVSQILFKFSLLGLFFIICSNPVSAQVLITEVNPAPLTGEKEWIELYNSGSETEDLSLWFLEDSLSSPSVLVTFPSETLLASKEFLFIELSSAKLNNSGDAVTLFDADLQEIDHMEYTSSESGKSWQFDQSEEAWLLDEPTPNEPYTQQTDTTPEETPTPLPSPTANPIPTTPPANTPTPSPVPQIDLSKLEITEIFACPETGDPEWIELHNSSSSTLQLTDWTVSDAANHNHTFSLTLSSGSYSIIELPTNILNNSGDTVTVFSSSQALDSLAFPACKSGSSLSLQNSGSWENTNPTPNRANQQVSTQSTSTQAPSSQVIQIRGTSTDDTQQKDQEQSLVLGENSPAPQTAAIDDTEIRYTLPILTSTLDSESSSSSNLTDTEAFIASNAATLSASAQHMLRKINQPVATLPFDENSISEWRKYGVMSAILVIGCSLLWILWKAWHFWYAPVKIKKPTPNENQVTQKTTHSISRSSVSHSSSGRNQNI